MLRYYTRVCNFYYGKNSNKKINKRKSIPLNGNKEISFDTIELISRKSRKKIPVSKINSLPLNLKKDVKDQTIVKLFPDKNSAVIKKIWQLNTTKNIKIFSDGPYYKYKWFKETRIVIMDDISTPLYETLYLNIPTVIITS